jgi:hypothetical protein
LTSLSFLLTSLGGLTVPQVEINERATSYEKGTKIQKMYEVMKKVQSYEKGMQLRKRYEVTKRVRR